MFAEFKYPAVDTEATLSDATAYDLILQCLAVLTASCGMICAQVWCFICRRFNGLWGTFWSSLAAGSMSEYITNIPLWQKSLIVQLSNYLRMRCFVFHHSALHLLLYLILTNKTFNKSAILPFKICECNGACKSFSVQYEPYTNFPHNRPLGQHRHTWFRLSHSGIQQTATLHKPK